MTSKLARLGTMAIAVIVMVASLFTVSQRDAAAAPAHEAAYVTKTFELFLGRAPTPDELRQAQTTSMTTDQGRQRLANNLTTSGEWYVNTVQDLYERILRRRADPRGFLHWVATLGSGTTSFDRAEASFYSSSEYFGNGDGTVEGWIDRIYQDLFGRAADPGGRNHWAQLARSRGRSWAVTRLMASAEGSHRRIVADFSRILGRSPDPSELDAWTHWEGAVGQVAAQVGLASLAEAYGPLAPGEQVVAAPPVPLPEQFSRNGLTSKLVTVRSAGWSSTTAEFTGWERSVVGWRRVLGPWTARSGRGWSMPTVRREGAGTTPAGRYRFSGGFGLAENPGYRLGWFVVGPQDYWTSDPTRWDYNMHRRGPANPATAPWRSAEHLIDHPVAYRYAAVIDFNSPPTGPFGSAIFLHVSTGGPTAGCVSLPETQLVSVLRWIDGDTRIVMGPDSVIRTF